MKAQYGILRFKKYKGPAISPIEAHNERTKEQYASNPDIDTSRSRYNLHLVQPQGRYREEANRMIAAAHCRVRKDSVRVVEALVTASPEFFKDKTNREIRAYFAYALKFLEGRQCPDTFLSAVVHMDEKTPHLHLCFVPLTPDGRLSAKEIIGNRKNLVKWQDEFWQHMVKQYPELERGESASQTGREHIPPRIFKEMTQLTQQKEQLDALLVGINPFNGKNQQGAGQLYPQRSTDEGPAAKVQRSLHQDRRRKRKAEREEQDALCLAGQSEGRERLEASGGCQAAAGL